MDIESEANERDIEKEALVENGRADEVTVVVPEDDVEPNHDIVMEAAGPEEEEEALESKEE